MNNERAKKVLITGASGLLGYEVLRKFSKEGSYTLLAGYHNTKPTLISSANLEWVRVNLFDVAALEELVSEVDYVVHCAGLVSFSASSKDELFKVNHEGTANLVNVALKAPNLKCLIHISSIAALGKPDLNRYVNESNLWESEKHTTVYGYSKFLGELEVHRAMAEGLSAVILNPSVILGTGAKKGASSSALFHYVKDGKPFFTRGWLNYVDVRDVAEAVKICLENQDHWGERYILNAGHIPYNEFMTKVAMATGCKVPSIEMKPWMGELFWRMAWLLKWFGIRLPITKETPRSAQRRTTYDGSLFKQEANFQYRPIDETIKWVTSQLKEN